MAYFSTTEPEEEEELYNGQPMRVLHKSGKKSGVCFSCGRKTTAVYHKGATGLSHSECKWCGARLGGWGATL